MARNKEKHVVKLNRLWLQTLDEENLKKNPPRPGLGSLNSASEIKKWIPSIKRDIDFCLKQSQVTCYPDSHIEDFSTRIEALTGEYKAYIRKLREVEPRTGAVPWTDRPYKRKHKPHEFTVGSTAAADAGESSSKIKKADFCAIASPVLEAEDSLKDLYGYCDTPSEIVQNADPETEDLPLVFRSKQLSIEAPTSQASYDDLENYRATDSSKIRGSYLHTSDSRNGMLAIESVRDRDTGGSAVSDGPSTSTAMSECPKLLVQYSDSSSSAEEED